MGLPKEIADLVERFEQNREAYKSGQYNEAQLRQDFLNPLFGALGWDMANTAGYAEAYREVIHEDAIKIGSETKAPDYCFRIGGTRKFFLEAKKPSVFIKEDIPAAFQLRRYAWSAKLPLSVLCDFEEFAVYDTRIKPDRSDKASAARIHYFTYKEYADKWEEMAAVFSRDAVLKGSFDKYAEKSRLKKGTATVDDAFLTEIEDWRDMLAKNIALRNADLSTRELNFAVQRTIDRIVFLRICEDRGIEEYGRLQSQLNGTNVYKRLVQLFSQADDRYNSGLFHFQREKDRHEEPDKLTPNITIDDKPLKDIINRLYYPESPYEFSVLSADILGQVYEQFLGKVIRLTAGHQAKVEEKPEVRKAGGVYYTPKYIVDYIVKNTVGKLVEDKKPKEIEKLTILDPACGSGSFLLGAYQYLLDWHLKWYIENEPDKWAKVKQPAIYQGPSPDSRTPNWHLTTAEKKRILLNNIYGVDIDSQAVEVTKLSLLLKVLEGENNQTLANQLRMFHERALPDLGDNIKCGNSLIGPDFYQQQTMLDDEERYRVNVFDWDKEFPHIFTPSPQRGEGGGEGGFDAVIGNPPYIRIQALKEWAPIEVEIYKEQYKAAGTGNYDIYVVFVEKGLQLLNKRGRLGYILPHKFFNAKYGEPLRQLISRGKNIGHIVHFGDQQVFKGATTYTALLFLDKKGNDSFDLLRVNDLQDWLAGSPQDAGRIESGDVTISEWNFTAGKKASLFKKLRQFPVKFGDIAHIFVGLQTSADTVFLFKDRKVLSQKLTKVYSKELDAEVSIETALLKPVVRSGSIGRYRTSPTALVLFPYETSSGTALLISESSMKKDYPKAWEYLNKNKTLLSEREHGKFKSTGWYQLYPKNLDFWEQPKILVPYMVTELSAYYDQANLYFVNVTTGGFGITTHDIKEKSEYLTGLLNSKLLDWFLKNVSTTFHGGYFAANKQFLVQLPIRTIEFSDPADCDRHDKMVSLVDQMVSLNRKLPELKTDHEKTTLQRQIAATDQQIDQLVYELYGLTEEEKKIVEGKAGE